jgi:hypothetical protein
VFLCVWDMLRVAAATAPAGRALPAQHSSSSGSSVFRLPAGWTGVCHVAVTPPSIVAFSGAACEYVSAAVLQLVQAACAEVQSRLAASQVSLQDGAIGCVVC